MTMFYAFWQSVKIEKLPADNFSKAWQIRRLNRGVMVMLKGVKNG